MRPLLVLLVLAVVAALALTLVVSDRPMETVVRLEQVEDRSDAPERADLGAPERTTAAAIRSKAEVEAVTPASARRATESEWPKGFARIDFVVRDGAAPVEGASLALSEGVSPTFIGDLDEGGAARTDERGQASFYVRPTRTVEVQAAAHGSIWATTQYFTSPFEERTRRIVVELTIFAEDAMFDVLARSLPSLAPLEGAVVEVSPPVGVEITSTKTYTTGPDGRVAVPWREGLRYGVTATGHAASVIARPDVRDGPPVLVDLKKHARLSGSIALPQGEPPTSATVRLLDQQIWSNAEKKAAMRALRGRMPAIRELMTAEVHADGSWAMEGIAFGAEVDELEGLRVDALVDGTERALAFDLVLRPGDDLVLHDEWASGPPLTIEARYASGNAVGAGTPVYLIEGEGASARLAASRALDSAGDAHFSTVRSGVWSYALRHVDPRAVRIDGTFDHTAAAPVRLVVPGFDAVAGRVDLSDGVFKDRVYGGWSVGMRGVGEERWEDYVTAHRDGSFQFDFVPSGKRVEVAVFPNDRFRGEMRVDLKANQATPPPLVSVTATAGDLDVVLDLSGK